MTVHFTVAATALDGGVDYDWAIGHIDALAEALLRVLVPPPVGMRFDVAPLQSADSGKHIGSGFVVHITVPLDGHSFQGAAEGDEGLIDQVIRDLLSNEEGADSESLLLLELAAVLVEREGHAPAWLQDAAVSLEGEPILGNLSPLLASWLTQDWQQCPAKCGEADQERGVFCSHGVPSACWSQVGAPPEARRKCSSYEACSFELTCPFGRDHHATCETQLAIAVSIPCITCVCCCLCLCFAFVTCRKPREGRIFLPDLEMDAIFHIVEGQQSHAAAQHRSEIEGTAFHDGNGACDRKTHIVWDIDLEQADRWIKDHEVRPKTPQQSQMVTRSSVAHAHAIAPHHDGRIVPAYKDGTLVEYFSRTHSRWVLGHVTSSAPASRPTELQYHVDLALSNQRRSHVPLEDLRLPLGQGVMVDVRCEGTRGGCGGGAWQPGTLLEGWTTTGYRVRLERMQEEDEGNASESRQVPSAKVRRRFLVGQRVEVYCGPLRGWLAAVVCVADEHTLCEAFTVQSFVSQPDLDGDQPPNPDDRATHLSSSLEEEVDAWTASKSHWVSLPPLQTSDGSHFRVEDLLDDRSWVVPVQIVAGRHHRSQLVAAYLIRPSFDAEIDREGMGHFGGDYATLLPCSASLLAPKSPCSGPPGEMQCTDLSI